MKWRDVIAIHVVPARSSHGRYLMTLEFREYGRVRRLEAGLIDNDCLAKVRTRYGTSLKFDDKPEPEGSAI